MWRLCKLGYRHEPRLLVAAFVLSLLAALPDALLALWLKLLAEGVARATTGACCCVAALGLAAVGRRHLVPAHRSAPGCSAASATGSPSRSRPTSPGCRRRWPPSRTRSGPSYLDRLSVLRDQVFVLDHMYMSVFSTCGWILRLGVTVALLMSIHPALALLALFALPDRADARRWRPAVERTAEERGRARQPPGPAPVRHRHHRAARQGGAGHRHRRRGSCGSAGAAWERWYGPVVGRPAGVSAVWHTLAWAVFGAGYVGAVVFVAVGARRARRATCCSCSRPARGCRRTSARPSARSASCAASGWTARGGWPGWRTTRRRSSATADLPVPDRADAAGIRLEHVSFAYPGTDRLVLDDVSLELPAGAVVAIVGENGAGKTTLVKLLCQALRADGGPDPRRRRRPGPDAGRRVARPAGRRVPGLLPVRAAAPAQSVGVGDVPRLDDDAGGRARPSTGPGPTTWSTGSPPASTPSSARPGPTASRSRSGSGRSSRWPAASCATSRCCSCSTSPPPRSTPRPSTRCSSATPARRAAPTAPTTAASRILVSHRFCTVRMADLIVVLDGARVVEVGTPRGAHGRGRPVRRALRHPGRGLPLIADGVAVGRGWPGHWSAEPRGRTG